MKKLTFALSAFFALIPSLAFSGLHIQQGDPVTASSITVTGANGISATYGITAGSVTVADDAYDSTGWNGNNEVPTKNAVRDKIETLGAGGLSSVNIDSDGVTVISTNTINFLPSTGFSWTIAGPSSATVQGVPDTAILATKASIQTGEPLFCDTNSNSGTTYACSMVPTLSGYTTGQVFNVAIDSTSTGAATLNIDSLGADSLLKSDGSAIASGDLVAGTLIQVWHDGTDFRLVDPVEGISGVAWGAITGTLSDQTDLQSVLSAIGTSTQTLKATPYFKGVTVESPTSSEDITLFFTDDAITITQMNAVCVGTTPSVTWTIRHGSDRSATGNEVVTSGTTTTSTTTGSEVTSFNDATIPAGSWVWMETTAQSGTVTDLNVTLEFTRD